MTNLTRNENFSEALHNLVDGRFSIANEEVTFHDGDTLPSDVVIQVELDRLQAEYDALSWERLRQAEYPSVQECVHAILDDTLDALQAKRAEIKTKYPKGG